MRRYVPYLLIATMTLLAGLATLWSWNQSRSIDRTIGIVATCTSHVTHEPAQLMAACADANAYLTSLHWMDWGNTTAYATGIGRWNDCVPNCAGGHWRSEPIEAWAWDIKHGLYTRLQSSDPRFFNDFVVTPYPPALG